jgi:hypothetical protein
LVAHRRRGAVTPFVVTGPPAGGKTSWVRDHAKYGDVVIDYDAIVAGLTVGDVPGDPAGQPVHLAEVAKAARASAINEAIELHDRPRLDIPFDVYIVHTTPSRQHLNQYRKHGAHMVERDPGYAECMRRAELERTPRQQAFVRDWYERHGLTV